MNLNFLATDTKFLQLLEILHYRWLFKEMYPDLCLNWSWNQNYKQHVLESLWLGSYRLICCLINQLRLGCKTFVWCSAPSHRLLWQTVWPYCRSMWTQQLFFWTRTGLVLQFYPCFTGNTGIMFHNSELWALLDLFFYHVITFIFTIVKDSKELVPLSVEKVTNDVGTIKKT